LVDDDQSDILMQLGIAQPSSGVMRIWVLVSLLGCGIGQSLELPESFAGLSAAQFDRRESSQADLLEWARQNPGPAMDELYKQSRFAVDPEARARCIEVLRSLVCEEYMKEGEGYIGIALSDEIHKVPGEAVPRNVIRVTEVRGDTPGQKAGIRLNDLIVGFDGKGWLDNQSSALFRERIRGMKPESNVGLTILRDGKLLEVKVRLGRRPLAADFFLNGINLDTESAEKAAKEAYFNRWMLQMRQKN
jgi:predicted metalloprotease with PDZ domain